MEYRDFKSEIWTMMYLVKSSMQKIIEPIAQREGLSMIQSYILFTIGEEKAINISSLSKILGLNQGNTSTMCKSIEKLGLIERKRSSEDERVVMLSLTKEGLKMIERLYASSCQLDENLKKISMEKLQKIIDGMSEFNELLLVLSENKTTKEEEK